MKTAQQLIREAHNACNAIAEGPVTPIVFERFEYIGGETGYRLGFSSQTADGRACIVWL